MAEPSQEAVTTGTPQEAETEGAKHPGFSLLPAPGEAPWQN